MKKIIKNTICALILSGLFIIPVLVMAQDDSMTTAPKMLQRLQQVAGTSGYQTDSTKASTAIIVGTVIRAFLNFLGLVFIVLMILSGYNWMTAQGNEEQVTKAQRNIKQAIIGLIVTASGWIIWRFVFEKFILMQ